MLKSRYMERTQAIQSLSATTPIKVQKRGSAHPMRLPVFGFLGAIALGTILLSLPIANQQPTRLLDALFTATSAVCVTGLTVLDTGTQFTPFGLIVLTILMQIGGLGIMTFSTTLLLVAGAKTGFAQHTVILSSFTQADGQYSPGKILKEVIKFTVILEGVGAAIFFSQAGFLAWPERLLFSIFHAVSAFCNAGFSTLPDSFMSYRGHWIINLNLIFLIITGGIGFVTLSELLSARRQSLRRISLHSRLALGTTAVLLLGGTIAILLFEWRNTLNSLPWWDKILSAFFQSVTARTAGFNTLNIGQLSGQALFVIIILMYIGGSPGSCAGGIKTTTSAVLAALGFNRFLGREKTQILNRTIPEEIVERSTRLFVLTIILLSGSVLILMITETSSLNGAQTHAAFLPVLFETVSAFATCGLSMGITPQLSDAGRLVIIALMFIGRLGPLVLVTAVSKPPQEQPWFAEEHIMVG